ncbi:cupin domain-containing protein [Phenylobacterium sp.]|uniref:cupin domain-containing protein n=1 Tax=Phenylobacterium sp. TaxID=1871053 RepID=UPI002731303C|nr:cupin domain-containing protein [Phenylobacterium sp.]MDP1616154.1 cupin domain-containing protein [Phenylobacterium sp.]MDP1986051.1 cupin domain-containing protein [Phenylobacterium sp.]
MRKLTLAVCVAVFATPALAVAAPGQPPSFDAGGPAAMTLALPQTEDPVEGEKVRMTVVQATLAPGESLPDNARTALRYIYVKSGRLQVSNLVTGDEQEILAGEFAVESAGQWHTGRALGAEPAEVLLIEQAPSADF